MKCKIKIKKTWIRKNKNQKKNKNLAPPPTMKSCLGGKKGLCICLSLKIVIQDDG